MSCAESPFRDVLRLAPVGLEPESNRLLLHLLVYLDNSDQLVDYQIEHHSTCNTSAAAAIFLLLTTAAIVLRETKITSACYISSAALI
jgi:hypothetical protein